VSKCAAGSTTDNKGIGAMPKVLIVHGAGMNMRGKAQIEIFGPMTLPQYDVHIRKYATDLGIDTEIFHSKAKSLTGFTTPMSAASMRRLSIRRATRPVTRR
jgi:hypothetical protein